MGSVQVTWDGTKETGGKIDAGVYYIYAEAKDDCGNKGDNLDTSSQIKDHASADPSFIQADRRPEFMRPGLGAK